MPEIIDCPQCERKLRVPEEMLGRTVKCPSCSTVFTARAPGVETVSPPAEEDDVVEEGVEEASARRRPPAWRPVDDQEDEYADRPRRRRPADDDEEEDEDADRPRRKRRSGGRRYTGGLTGNAKGWQKVRLGITLILTAILVMLGTLILLPCGMLVGGAAAFSLAAPGPGGQPGNPGAALGVVGMIAILTVVLMLASHILTLVGYGFCMGAPDESGARGLATATLSLSLASMVASGVSLVMVLAAGAGLAAANPFALGAAGTLSMLLSFGQMILSLAAMFTFLFFLRAVADALREGALAASIQSLIMLFGISLGAFVVMRLVAMLFLAGGGVGRGAAPAFGLVMLSVTCIAGIGLIVAAIWYLVVLFQVRGALTNYLERS